MDIVIRRDLVVSVEAGWFGRWRVYVTDATRKQWLGTVKTLVLAEVFARQFADGLRAKVRKAA